MRASRAETLTLLLLIAGLLLSLPLLVRDTYDPRNDASMYIVMARSIASGEGYTYLGQPFGMRPPAFSAMIAPFVGSADVDFRALNLEISLFGVLAVVLLYLHQRSRVGRLLALLTAAAVWLNPGFQRLCNQVLSDVPGLALVLACLLLERRLRKLPGWWGDLLLGLAVGAACYMRSITILLLPAFVLARLAARWFDREDGEREGWGRFAVRRVLVLVVAAWLVLLPWNLWKGRNSTPPPADQTRNYTLSTAMWHEDPGDPASRRYGIGEVLARIPGHAPAISGVMGSRMALRVPGEPLPGGTAGLGHALVTLLLLAGLATVLVRRREPAELFAAGSLAVVSVYFVFTDRLVLTTYVLALAATVEVARDLLQRLTGERRARIVLAGALLLLIALDFSPRLRWDEIRESHQTQVALAREVESRLRPEDRLGSAQGFHYSVYLDRPVYSLIHAVRRSGRAESAEQIIDKYAIDTVLLSDLSPQDRLLQPYFEQRYGPGESVGAGRLWRVRP